MITSRRRTDMSTDRESFLKSFTKLVGSWGKDLEKISSKLKDLYKQRQAIAADFSLALDEIYRAVGQLEIPDDADDSDARLCADILSKKASVLMPLLTPEIKAKFTGRPKWLKIDAMGEWTTEWTKDL
jgi:hypothetical protein